MRCACGGGGGGGVVPGVMLRSGVRSRTADWLMHLCVVPPVVRLQVCRGLSSGQADVVSGFGSGQPHAAPRLPVLRGPSTGGPVPAPLPLHEVSLRPNGQRGGGGGV